MHRVGIIPFDTKGPAMVVLFVTSQTRRRWILPKGLAKKKEKHADTCHREGFEEAGVRGVVLEDFPLTVLISKKAGGKKEQVPVTYYPFLVQAQEDDWPDQKRRERHWALIEDATKVTYREDVLALIRQFQALAPWIREVAERYKS